MADSVPKSLLKRLKCPVNKDSKISYDIKKIV